MKEASIGFVESPPRIDPSNRVQVGQGIEIVPPAHWDLNTTLVTPSCVPHPIHLQSLVKVVTMHVLAMHVPWQVGHHSMLVVMYPWKIEVVSPHRVGGMPIDIETLRAMSKHS